METKTPLHSYGLNSKFEMNVTDAHTIINLSLPIAVHIYQGNQDLCGVKYGVGKETWDHKWNQKYQGIFYKNCLHSLGTYEWNYAKEKYAYDGKIYANNLEGYGVVSYPDGSTFEGLFKNNGRYGPGVYTYADGKQDVGLWNGLSLVRLSTSVDTNTVPNLAKSLQGKIYLIQYRKLISLAPRSCRTDELLQQLKGSDKLQRERSKLCNSFIRNPKSIFFDTENFDRTYLSDETQTVDVVMSFEKGIPLLQKKVVSDIIAWNNEEESISIMKHTFLHRNDERNVTFNINSIIVGERDDFKEQGTLESICQDFFIASINGDHRQIVKLITDHDLNPDLADLNGNTGIHCASANNRLPAIKTLINFGANIDALNDEGLASLALSILNYIATKNQIKDWEKAFLPGTPRDEKNDQWRSNMTFDLVASREGLSREQSYILDLQCKHPQASKLKIIKSTKSILKVDSRLKSNKTISKIKSRFKSEPPGPTPEEIQGNLEREQTLSNIRDTIHLLLYYGADPNKGEIPLPPLILAVFSKEVELVQTMIKFGADCNITTAHKDGGLTALHVITALKPSVELINIAITLLVSGADRNARANTDHWLEEKQAIDPGSLCEDEGKTPLHLLSMRHDYIEDTDNFMCVLYEILVQNGCDPNLYYLGHTCLSLALIRGNISLMNKILESYQIDPNQFLGCNMGVPLTVPILKRYKGLLPVAKCKDIYEVLNHFNANPFNSLPKFVGNCIEFCENDNKEDKNKKGKKIIGFSNVPIINLLTEYAQEFLERHIQAKAIRYIYEYKIECGFSDPIFEAMAKFVSVDIALRILQTLMNHDKINYNSTGFYNLIRYVQKITEPKSRSKLEVIRNKSSISQKPQEMQEFIRNMVQEDIPIQIVAAPLPEVDPDEEKYKVCFNCLKKTQKTLVLCPKCELVYFCSERCNKSNLERNTIHKCQGLFYSIELKKMKSKSGSKSTITIDKFKKYRDDFLADPNNSFEIRYGFSGLIGSSYAAVESNILKTQSKLIEASKSKERAGSVASEEDENNLLKTRSKFMEASKSKERAGSLASEEDENNLLKTHSKLIENSKSKERTGVATSEEDKGEKTGNADDDSLGGGKPIKSINKLGRSRKSKHSSRKAKDSAQETKGKKNGKRKTTGDLLARKSTKLDISKKSKSRGTLNKSRSPTPKDKDGLDGDLSKDLPQTKSQALLDEKQGAHGLVTAAKDGEKHLDVAKPAASGLATSTKDGGQKSDEITGTENLGDRLKLLESDMSGLLLILKLNKMFLPCCVLINGQLYYKFGTGNTFCGLTYSNV